MRLLDIIDKPDGTFDIIGEDENGRVWEYASCYFLAPEVTDAQIKDGKIQFKMRMRPQQNRIEVHYWCDVE